jgi:hypothetical protein
MILETKELRTAPRFRLQNPIRLQGGTLPLFVAPTGKSRVIHGHVQNISSGGLCLFSRQRLDISELLVGEIAVPGTRASIPTLLQVRWLHQNSFGPRFRAGLSFVLQGSITQTLQTSPKTAGPTPTGKGAGADHPRQLVHMVN